MTAAKDKDICPVGGERFNKVHTHGLGGARIFPAPDGPRPKPSTPPPDYYKDRKNGN